MDDVVIGVDASTTAVKAIAFTREGTELVEARAPYPLSHPHPGHVEQNPEDWWQALVQALGEIAASLGSSRIAALALAHQRETFALIDRHGRAVRPAILWIDERARKQVTRLSENLGRDWIRDISGKPPDPTPALYAAAWLAEHEPDHIKSAHALVDVSGFLHLRLTGKLITSTASADPLGMLGLEAGDWQGELVSAAGLRRDQLPGLVDPGAMVGELTASAADLCGLPMGLPVIAGAGDGQAMGLGMGVFEAGKAYVSLGSGVVSGTYSKNYVTSDAFRTLTSPTGEGFMLETVLRSGMQLVDWVVRTTKATSVVALEKEAALVTPGSDGLLIMPYWSGVMNPHWDETARGAAFGFSLDHTPAHLLRAVLEGIAFEQALATEAMETSLGDQATSMIAAGGGTNSGLLMQILASVLERPIAVSEVKEAAALGAAMLAASAIGWFSSPEAASQAMTLKPTRLVEPVADLVDLYRVRRDIYRGVFPATRDIHARLHKLQSVDKEERARLQKVPPVVADD